jgi:ribonuclease G
VTGLSKKIIITDMDVLGTQTRIAGLFEEQKLLDVRCESKAQASVLGNIYVGRVQKVVKNIKAAFIEIAPGFACYYPLEDFHNPIFVKKIPSPNLVQGDELLVQVHKEGVKTKQPTVTTNLNLTGRYVVLTSGDKKIGLSSKFDKATKERFRTLLEAQPMDAYGVIVRTNAKNATDEEVLEELNRLSVQLTELIEKAKMRICFSCVYQTESKYMTYLQNSYQDDLTEIVTDLVDVYNEISAYRKHYPAMQQVPLRLYEDRLLPLSKLYNLERQMERALSKKVWLKSGGYLVIEPTEALTVIDVNTGKSVAKADPQKHFLQINIEAAREIALQLRLRNISGIILIDFINLSSKEDQTRMIDELKHAVKGDPMPVQVHDITKLNLVELTRKKNEKSLSEQLTS